MPDFFRAPFSGWMSILVIALTARCVAQQPKEKASPQRTVVFVCEHGAAKSVIAAAWFNKLAVQRHLPFHAIARGTTPQAELSESAVAGLKRDGVSFPSDKPLPFIAKDANNATRIVAFCPLPASSVAASKNASPEKPTNVESFDVPAPKDGYDQSRDAILVHVKALLDELEGRAPKPR